MRVGYRDVCLEHDTGPRHPESPDRLRAIKRALASRHNVEYVAPEATDRGSALAVHTNGYINELERFCEDGGGNWDADTVAVEETWDAAFAAAGLAEWAAEAALDGADGRETPFALGRPPGHHAVADDAMGFCFLNNAAVAAQSMLDAGAADRVAIFDWDVHHGNGTQDIFYDREDVFYASVHEDGLYPGTGEIPETGEGDAEGTTLNVPFPAGCGDAEYVAAVEEVIGPAIVEFDPDLLIVSAGFDAHEHDPISRMVVTTDGYGLLTDVLRSTVAEADAAMAFVLEGGYSLETLSEGVAQVHEVFDGLEPHAHDWEISESGRSVIEEVKAQGFPSREPFDHDEPDPGTDEE
ncbi:histone deacetylase [Halapricum sp. CBA1109]|uniref:histone deacetylase family protein n=1 Tax=Halapricum sp. CBA1109 TaxID=2668068 RepID=UPI0012FAE383|nr:histone deacetylase [Halapricum sp. CBA1109]MUV90282.1 histone deacetylase [Halapricum sp. CBA1109]